MRVIRTIADLLQDGDILEMEVDLEERFDLATYEPNPDLDLGDLLNQDVSPVGSVDLDNPPEQIKFTEDDYAELEQVFNALMKGNEAETILQRGNLTAALQQDIVESTGEAGEAAATHEATSGADEREAAEVEQEMGGTETSISSALAIEAGPEDPPASVEVKQEAGGVKQELSSAAEAGPSSATGKERPPPAATLEAGPSSAAGQQAEQKLGKAKRASDKKRPPLAAALEAGPSSTSAQQAEQKLGKAKRASDRKRKIPELEKWEVETRRQPPKKSKSKRSSKSRSKPPTREAPRAGRAPKQPPAEISLKRLTQGGIKMPPFLQPWLHLKPGQSKITLGPPSPMPPPSCPAMPPTALPTRPPKMDAQDKDKLILNKLMVISPMLALTRRFAYLVNSRNGTSWKRGCTLDSEGNHPLVDILKECLSKVEKEDPLVIHGI